MTMVQDPTMVPVRTFVIEPVAAEAPRESRRRISSFRRSDLLALIGALLGSVALTALLFSQIAPFSGAIGFIAVAYVGFVALYALLVSFDESKATVKDRIASVIVHTLATLLIAALTFILVYTIGRGLSAVVHSNFWQEDLANAGPLDPVTKGGIIHGIVGTLIEISIALAIVIPLGLTCAVFLNEIPGRFSRFVRIIVEAMTALPSIVAGLFIFAVWVLVLGLQRCGLAAALAISVMMLPIIIRAADVVLRLVPGSLKEASLALGTGQWRTVWHVVLPTSRSGLATAVILGAARGIGETSPVLLTAGFGASLNANPTEGPMVSLPLLTFQLLKSPEPAQIARGFGAAVALLLVVLVLFVTARLIGGRGPGQSTKRQRRARARQSAADVARMQAHAAAVATSSIPAQPSPATPTAQGDRS